LATANFRQKADTFSKMHPNPETSSVLPLSNYLGKVPDPNKDFYDRRTIVDHDPFKSEVDPRKSEPEPLRNLKRFPKGIMNE